MEKDHFISSRFEKHGLKGFYLFRWHGKQNNGPQRCPYPVLRSPWNLWIYYTGKKDIADMIKVKIFKIEDYLGYPSRSNVITMVLINGKQKDQSKKMWQQNQRWQWCIHCWKGATNQRMQTVSRSWKRQRINSRAYRECNPAKTLISVL